MEEPKIIAHHREQLAYLLTEAAEIEHGLMCCYLFASYSLKRGSDGLSIDEVEAIRRWRGAVVSVAVEEMLHLALVSNLLTAIGFAPQFARPNFPVAPGFHPSGVVVSLAPFSPATLDHFIFLERPEGVDVPDGDGFEPPPAAERATRADRLVPSSEDYATVGHLYRGVRDGFIELSARMGEVELFVGAPAAQVGQHIVSLPGLTQVTDLASALRAIDTIVEQGEGTSADSERSHYRRFIAVRDEYRAFSKARPDFAPAHPVARNPVMRKPPTPLGKVHVQEPKAARTMDLGNAVYGHMLRLLGRAFGQSEDSPEARGVLVDAAIECMTIVSPLAEALALLPADAQNPSVHAGLSFAVARSTMGSQQCGAWPLLAERTRELASACADAAKALDSSLEECARRLGAIALRIDRAAPVARGSDVAASAGAAQAPSTSPSPGLEEAQGKRLTVRFEGKRCIHSRHCVLAAPEVFRANVEGPWLHPDEASVESLVGVAHDCPSGAITYERHDGGPPESAPPINVVRVRENGPLAAHADIELDGQRRMFRAALCRCGASKNKPFCDSSHHGVNFAATGEPATRESAALDARGGVLAVVAVPNGPLAVTGNIEICSGTGRTIDRLKATRFCRCGGSANKPFCDGSHARNGFRS